MVELKVRASKSSRNDGPASSYLSVCERSLRGRHWPRHCLHHPQHNHHQLPWCRYPIYAGYLPIQASHRKYQCLGCFGFAGDTGFSSTALAEMALIFTTRLLGITYPTPSAPAKW